MPTLSAPALPGTELPDTALVSAGLVSTGPVRAGLVSTGPVKAGPVSTRPANTAADRRPDLHERAPFRAHHAVSAAIGPTWIADLARAVTARHNWFA
jgi:hypothetical protein